ncbi:hypothetical protein [Paenarthrobacter aurescens]|uniref:hypothetical protein n=1 Tax=Paenarthrobacter aurescens TaxID=43663 RepID=UPI0021BEDDF6|nr:hypothetical protein [Paenarthrobacter aurescens]MCT9871452.1 hypothetical protein [Paenarthrobacter aurescens]
MPSPAMLASKTSPAMNKRWVSGASVNAGAAFTAISWGDFTLFSWGASVACFSFYPSVRGTRQK